MREFLIEEDLQRKLNKLFKKDKVTYEIIMKKIEEILICGDVNHYKNLRKPLQHLKRVHVRSSFVLTFNIVGEKVIFYDFDHHDNIYQ